MLVSVGSKRLEAGTFVRWCRGWVCEVDLDSFVVGKRIVGGTFGNNCIASAIPSAAHYRDVIPAGLGYPRNTHTSTLYQVDGLVSDQNLHSSSTSSSTSPHSLTSYKLPAYNTCLGRHGRGHAFCSGIIAPNPHPHPPRMAPREYLKRTSLFDPSLSDP